MKFRIRYADQLVGFFIIVALLSIIVLIFLLGSKQRWFSQDYVFKTYAGSVSGLSRNMPVMYKGFTIGNVKTFDLTDDDRVEIIFTIHDKYKNRARQGSLVDILVSPIGLGNQFLFYPGLGSGELEENEFVPMASSVEGKELIAKGLGYIPNHDDSITILMTRANTLLEEINRAIEGDESTTLGRTLLGVEGTITGLEGTLSGLDASITPLLEDLQLIVAAFREELTDPNGVLRLLDGDGELINGLEASISSLAGNLANLEDTTVLLPREVPRLLSDVEGALLSAQDVLTALRNNPLLRNGVPEHAETESSGTSPRNIEF
jgi:phospholipid/cholesterol/gamma-HCH transport system substrate-binding protein